MSGITVLSPSPSHISTRTQTTERASTSPSVAVDPDVWAILHPWGSGMHGQEIVPMVFRKSQRRYTIGRGPGNDYSYPNVSGMSSQQCVIEWDGEESCSSAITITNLSSHGTYIKDERMGQGQSRLLHDFTFISFRSPLRRSGGGSEQDLSFMFRRYHMDDNGNGIPSELRKSYDIHTTLGRGAFATVVKGLHVTENKWYAIKLFHKNFLTSVNGCTMDRDKMAKALKKEIDLMSQLVHPNIVQFKEAIYSEYDISIVMEFVSGGDLGQYVYKQPRGVLEEAETRYFTFQICEALTYLHARGIVHRDLKLENVLLTDGHSGRRVAKLADFGLAKLVSSRTFLQTECGTPMYMAPEIGQCGNEGYNEGVDSWSLGVMICVMLLGRSPFLHDTRQDVDWHHIKRFGISKEGQHIISHLLQRNPEMRLSAAKACLHPWLNRNHPHWHTNALSSRPDRASMHMQSPPLPPAHRHVHLTPAGALIRTAPVVYATTLFASVKRKYESDEDAGPSAYREVKQPRLNAPPPTSSFATISCPIHGLGAPSGPSRVFNAHPMPHPFLRPCPYYPTQVLPPNAYDQDDFTDLKVPVWASGAPNDRIWDVTSISPRP